MGRVLKKAASRKEVSRKAARRNENSKKMPIEYDPNTKMFIYTGERSGFSHERRTNIPRKAFPRKALCHRVSYKLMANALINAVNYYVVNYDKLDQQVLAKITEVCIYGIIIAVTGKFQQPLEKSENLINHFLELDKNKYQPCVEELMNALANLQKGNDKEISDVFPIAERCLNRILDNLNNEGFNLKVGNASWNSSIREAFDCFDDVGIEKKDGSVIVTLGERDSEVMTILLNMTMPGGDHFDKSELFVYTELLDTEETILCQSRRTDNLPEFPRKTPQCFIRYRDVFRPNKGYVLFENADASGHLISMQSETEASIASNIAHNTAAEEEKQSETEMSIALNLEGNTAVGEQNQMETGIARSAAGSSRKPIKYNDLREKHGASTSSAKVKRPGKGKAVSVNSRNGTERKKRSGKQRCF